MCKFEHWSWACGYAIEHYQDEYGDLKCPFIDQNNADANNCPLKKIISTVASTSHCYSCQLGVFSRIWTCGSCGHANLPESEQCQGSFTIHRDGKPTVLKMCGRKRKNQNWINLVSPKFLDDLEVRDCRCRGNLNTGKGCLPDAE